MKCTNKHLIAFVLGTILSFNVVGCGSNFSSPYVASTSETDSRNSLYYPTFASDICVVNTDILSDDVSLGDLVSAGLFDLGNKETLFAQNVNEQVRPASLTKVMTALVALKYGKLDQKLTATSDVYINESGAQKIGLKEGDSMTLDQALHLLLIYSANDVANLIATNISDSISGFADLMNEEARSIGATNSHFVNPNGLNADDHYVTAYDMYLIFNAAMQYDTFNEIINMTEYTTSYMTGGELKEVSVNNTNGYLSAGKSAPTGVTVIGGKTGTTQAAGHCLILLAKDINGNPYIAVIMRDTDSGTLYEDMSELLGEIVN